MPVRKREAAKILFGMIFLVSLLSIVQTAEAGGIRAWGIGARATSKGGAFVGEADDWTAIFWNPAGLATLKRSSVAVEPGFFFIKTQDGSSFNNYDTNTRSIYHGDIFPRVYNIPGLAVEPTRFKKIENVYKGASPYSSAGGNIHLKYLDIGFGAYCPANIATDWKDSMKDLVNNAEIDARYFATQQIFVYNVSVAKEIVPRLFVGAGFNLLDANTKLKAKKSYNSVAAPALNYNMSLEERAFGQGYEGEFGLLYHIIENKVSVGGTYRTGARVHLDGEADVTNTVLLDSEHSDYSQTLDYPSGFAVGVSCKPIEKLTLNLDWTRDDWHRYDRKISYQYQGLLLQNVDINWGWKISNQVGFGAEYFYKPEFALRAGLRWDQSPQSPETVSIANVTDLDKIWYTAGLGYKKGNFDYDFAFFTAPATERINNVKYWGTAFNWTFALKYSF